MSSPCSSKSSFLWWMQFSPSHLDAWEFGCIQKKHPWTRAAHARRLHQPIDWYVIAESCLSSKLYSGQWSQCWPSSFHFSFLQWWRSSSQFGCRTSRINPASINFRNSSLTIRFGTSPRFRLFYFIGLWLGLTLSQWVVTLRPMLGMSLCDHAK